MYYIRFRLGMGKLDAASCSFMIVKVCTKGLAGCRPLEETKEEETLARTGVLYISALFYEGPVTRRGLAIEETPTDGSLNTI